MAASGRTFVTMFFPLAIYSLAIGGFIARRQGNSNLVRFLSVLSTGVTLLLTILLCRHPDVETLAVLAVSAILLEITKQRSQKSDVWEIVGAILITEAIFLFALGVPAPLAIVIGSLGLINVAGFLRRLEAAESRKRLRETSRET